MTTPPPPVARTLDEANEIIARQHAEILSLRARVAELEALVAKLLARVGQNSTNSSRPPSSDPPWGPKRKPPEPPSGRKAGGQPGHEGHSREPVPPGRADRAEDVRPKRCTCGHEFGEHDECEDAWVHYVYELPEIRALITAWRRWSRRCPKCGRLVRAELPPGVPRDGCGPRLKATAATLSAKYRGSRRDVAEAMRDIFGVALSVGTVQKTCERVSEVVVPTVEQVRQEVVAAAAVHADETGWKQHGKKMWMWTATTPEAAYYVLAKDRGRDALALLLPEDYAGVVHCDRWRPYERYDAKHRQLCHSHLRRDFQGLIDRGGEAKPSGEWMLRESDRLFHLWHGFDRGEMTRQEMAVAMRPVRMRMGRAVARGTKSADRKVKALAKDLRRQWDALWTFTRVEGVEPTNNDAERAMRKPVLWRKGSFGTQSDAGAAFVARMETVIETARRRGVRLLDWLERACSAADFGLAPPPLFSG